MSADKRLLEQQISEFQAFLIAENYDEALKVCIEIEQHLKLFQLNNTMSSVCDKISNLKELYDISVDELQKKQRQIQIAIASINNFSSNKVIEAYQKNNY